MDRPAFYTLDTAAKALGLSRRQVQYRIRRGLIPARKMDRTVIIVASELEAALLALPPRTAGQFGRS